MKKIFVLLLFLFLAGCNPAPHEKITAKQFAAVLTIQKPGLTFVNADGTVIAKWFFDELYTGGILIKDELLLYGANLNQAVLYSFKTGEETARWDVPVGITSAAYLEKTNEVAFSVKQDQSVHFFNKKGKETAKIRTGNYPMTMLEYNERLYVINYQDTVLSEIDLHTYKLIREFAIPTSSTGMAINKEKKELWVGGHGYGAKASESVHIYSLESGALTATVNAPVMPVAFLEKNGYMYTASHGSNKIYLFDAKRRKIAEAKAPANPFALALFKGRLLSAGYDNGELTFYDNETLKKTKSISIGKGSFMIFIKEGE